MRARAPKQNNLQPFRFLATEDLHHTITKLTGLVQDLEHNGSDTARKSAASYRRALEQAQHELHTRKGST